MLFIVVPRHLDNYCGEGQSFELDFGKIQDIDKPLVFKSNINHALKHALKLYLSDVAANKLISSFDKEVAEGKNHACIEEFILMRDTTVGKLRYSLLQKLDNLTIECEDRTLKVPDFPLVLFEVFEL